MKKHFLYDNRVYVTIFILISLILAIDFKKNLKKNFHQLSFDWKDIRIIKEYGEVKVDSIAHNILVVKSNNKTYKNSLLKKYTFELSLGGKAYYFRCSSIQIKDQKIYLKSGRWLTNLPINNISKGKLKAVNIPLKKEFKKSICFIGDSQICWKSARSLRKDLYPYINRNFLGNNVDLFGYPYEGGENTKIKAILNNVKEIPKANCYLIFLGAQDFKNQLHYEDIEKKFSHLIDSLVYKTENSKVVLITLPNTISEKRNRYNKSLNNFFKSLQEEKIDIIDLQHYLEYNEINNYLYSDGIHMNDQGYKHLNKLIKEFVKNKNEN